MRLRPFSHVEECLRKLMIFVTMVTPQSVSLCSLYNNGYGQQDNKEHLSVVLLLHG